MESATTAGHLISVITESIGLKYPSGCGLFFKIGEKGNNTCLEINTMLLNVESENDSPFQLGSGRQSNQIYNS